MAVVSDSAPTIFYLYDHKTNTYHITLYYSLSGDASGGTCTWYPKLDSTFKAKFPKTHSYHFALASFYTTDSLIDTITLRFDPEICSFMNNDLFFSYPVVLYGHTDILNPPINLGLIVEDATKGFEVIYNSNINLKTYRTTLHLIGTPQRYIESISPVKIR